MILLSELKIALVSLPTIASEIAKYGKRTNIQISPPLGLGYIASYLKEKLGRINIRIIDGFFENPLKSILQFKPHLIGISAVTDNYYLAIDLTRRIRKISNAPLIVGGPHISLAPEYLKEPFDIAVLGEGEETMLDLVRLFIQENSFPQDTLRKIPGLAYKKDGRLILTERRKLIEDLDSIPMPDWRLFNKRYLEFPVSLGRRLKKRFNRIAAINTSRGCIYRCVFCAVPPMWNNIRFRSIESVIEEISVLFYRFGIDFITFYDDTFTCSIKRLKEIVRGLKDKGLLGKIGFFCNGTADTVREGTCRVMKEMGVINVFFGFESGSNRILQYLKKSRVSVEDNKRAFRLCKRFGIKVSASFIIGSPGETLEDIIKTIELIRWTLKNDVVSLLVRIAYPYPGTLWWQEAKRRGYIRGEESDIGFLNLVLKGLPLFLSAELWPAVNKIYYEIEKIKSRVF